MTDFLPKNYIHYLLLPLVAFLAGFIDVIVGGGGLVQVPSLFILFPQFPMPMIIGSNRFASFMGISVAAYQYTTKVKIPWKSACVAGVGTTFCVYLGAQFSSLLSANVLKNIVLVLMAMITIYTHRKKNLGKDEQFRIINILPWSSSSGRPPTFTMDSWGRARAVSWGLAL